LISSTALLAASGRILLLDQVGYGNHANQLLLSVDHDEAPDLAAGKTIPLSTVAL
jgi:hypothetical protein